MGTLATVRDSFLRDSGRFDLGTVGGEDNGADWFINSAQRYLDRLQETPMSFRRFQSDYDRGEGNFVIQDLIAPKKITIENDFGKSKLYHKEYDELVEIYDPEQEIQYGPPLYYDFAIAGLSPELSDLGYHNYAEQFTRQSTDVKFGNFWKTKTLVIRPVPDVSGTLILYGRFYSPILREDEDRSYWTEEAEQALVFASLYMLEASMRNRDASQYWHSLLGNELNVIDNELIWRDTYDKPIRRLG